MMSGRRARLVQCSWLFVQWAAALVAVALLVLGVWLAVSPSTAEREDDAARAHAARVAEEFTATTSTVTVQTPPTIDTATSTTTMIPVEVPPTWPAGGTVGLLTVEPAGIDSLPIVMPDSSVGESINEAMDAGVAVVYPESAPLSATAVGNSAITGHRTSHGAAFHRLDDVAVGDPIVIFNGDGIELHYVVVSVDLLMPTAVEIAHPTNVHDGHATLRLVTCSRPDGSPGGTSRRLVITAVLEAALSASPLTTVAD